VALTVLAVGVVLLMMMFAARSGPERIFAGPLHDPSVPRVTRTLSIPPGPRIRHHPGKGLIHSSPLFLAVGWVIGLAALALVLWLLYHGVRRLLRYLAERKPRAKPTPPAYVDFDVLDDPEPLIEEMRQGADEQYELLLGGLPRNAIVACWDRFEEQAERVNASRKAWETSSEFTLRLLEAVSADSHSVSRLEALYREARFSEHEMDESHRQEAIEALRAIHASLGIGAGARG
jgi:Domain of unknown function (DUF4129)